MGTYDVNGTKSPLSKSVSDGVQNTAGNGTFDVIGDQSPLSRTPTMAIADQVSNGTFQMMGDQSPLNRTPVGGGAWGLPEEGSTSGKK